MRVALLSHSILYYACHRKYLGNSLYVEYIYKVGYNFPTPSQLIPVFKVLTLSQAGLEPAKASGALFPSPKLSRLERWPQAISSALEVDLIHSCHWEHSRDQNITKNMNLIIDNFEQ